MESFWELLKNELVHHQRFKTRYRRQRKQTRLGYLSSVAFKHQLYEKRLAE